MMRRACGRSSSLLRSTFSRNPYRYQSTLNNAQTTEHTIKETETVSDNSFSIFPRIEYVKPEDLLGSGSFGKNCYFVERSTTGNLPVYTDYKAGGNKLVTEIRKITGDIVQLRNDLQNELPHIPKDSWRIIIQSKKIVIKGDAALEVKKVLEKKF